MNPNTPSASNNASQQCFPQAPAYVFYQMPMDQVRSTKYKSFTSSGVALLFLGFCSEQIIET